MTGTTPIYFFVTNGDNCHWDFPKKKKHPTYHYFNKVHHSGWRFLHHSEKKNSNLNLPMAASVIVGRWPLVIITIIIITMDPNIPKQKCKCVLYMSNGNEPFQSQFVFTYTHKSNKQNQIFFLLTIRLYLRRHLWWWWWKLLLSLSFIHIACLFVWLVGFET